MRGARCYEVPPLSTSPASSTYPSSLQCYPIANLLPTKLDTECIAELPSNPAPSDQALDQFKVQSSFRRDPPEGARHPLQGTCKLLGGAMKGGITAAVSECGNRVFWVWWVIHHLAACWLCLFIALSLFCVSVCLSSFFLFVCHVVFL